MTTKHDQILVPIDFYTIPMYAIEQAAIMAKKINAEITLLHVRKDTQKSSFFSFLPQEQTERIREEYINKTREKLEELAKEAAEKFNVIITPLLAKGKGYEKIIEVAELINAKFIIIPLNSGKHDHEHKYLGNNSSKVLRQAKCSVLTLNSEKIVREFKTVMLPLDLQKETRQKVTKACQFAKEFGAELRVVSALLTDNPEIVTRLKVQLDQVGKYIEKQGVAYTAEMVYGDETKDNLADLLMKYGEEQKVDMIWMMTQAENLLLKSFIGSTATRIINNSEISVMTNNPVEMEITRIKS